MSSPGYYPDWLLKRAGFSASHIEMYHKLRENLHWRTAEDWAELYLLLASIDQDASFEVDEWLPGT